ncbi:uncharacterized protein LOC141665536 [Apium graveolens]|uniref:uncharacterized protein LOC141665536 n=1 Tax=Apium graveolens TaxID=4045 RepID=UPI003D7BA0A1
MAARVHQGRSDFHVFQGLSLKRHSRRHLITFPPGILDKHYEKLLQCDQRLFNLSQKPFPTLNSPFFNSGHVQNLQVTTNNHRLGYFKDSITPGVVSQLPYVQNFGAPIGFLQNSQSLLSPKPHTANVDLNSAILDERANNVNYVIESEGAVYLGQGANILYQNCDGDESGSSNTPTDTSGLLFADDAGNQILLDDINSLIQLEGMNSNTNNISVNQLMSKHDQHFVTNHAFNQNCEADGLTLMRKPLSWLSHQDMNATGARIPSRDQSMYHYYVQEATEPNVETPNPSLIQHWE